MEVMIVLIVVLVVGIVVIEKCVGRIYADILHKEIHTDEMKRFGVDNLFVERVSKNLWMKSSRVRIDGTDLPFSAYPDFVKMSLSLLKFPNEYTTDELIFHLKGDLFIHKIAHKFIFAEELRSRKISSESKLDVLLLLSDYICIEDLT